MIENFFKMERDPFYIRGEQKGELKGRREEALEIARNLRSSGMEIVDIVKMTKLPITEIEKLR